MHGQLDLISLHSTFLPPWDYFKAKSKYRNIFLKHIFAELALHKKEQKSLLMIFLEYAVYSE